MAFVSTSWSVALICESWRRKIPYIKGTQTKPKRLLRLRFFARHWSAAGLSTYRDKILRPTFFHSVSGSLLFASDPAPSQYNMYSRGKNTERQTHAPGFAHAPLSALILVSIVLLSWLGLLIFFTTSTTLAQSA